MRIRLAVAWLAGVALLVDGCADNTTPATSITATGATLNADGRCDAQRQPCNWYFQYGTGGNYQRQTPVRTAQPSDTTGSANVTGLTPGTTYRYQLCGEEAGLGSYVCVGPDSHTGTFTSFTTPAIQPSGSGGSVVSSIPSGPETPAGGWTVEYANGFGAQLKQFGGQDNTFFPNRFPSRGCTTQPGHNNNEMENFTCDKVTVDPATGMHLTCAFGAPPNSIRSVSAINYDCGEANSNSTGMPAGYNGFSWMDPYGSGRTVAVEIKVQFPPNYDSDPGWWGTGSYANGQNGDEIDSFEGFGWGEAGNQTDCINGNACAQTWQKQQIAMPVVVQGGGDEIEGAAALGYDPSQAIHTYTTLYRPDNSISAYADGKLLTYTYPHPGTSFTPGSHTVEAQDLKLSYAMRGGGTVQVGGVPIQDPVPTFSQPGQWHEMVVRSVAIYENTAANNAGMMTTNGTVPLIAPGTTVK